MPEENYARPATPAADWRAHPFKKPCQRIHEPPAVSAFVVPTPSAEFTAAAKGNTFSATRLARPLVRMLPSCHY